MANVIPEVTIDTSKVKETWIQSEVVTNDTYNALNKAVIDLKDNNNLLDTNAMLFREEYNSSSKNLNNAIHQGIYSFTNSAVNAPSGVNGGNLLVTNTSKTNQGTSIITQIAFCHNGAVYARTKNNSENFTSWNKLAYITDNVASATKASQDSQGQAINTTYIKSITASNATLTVTKGNGTTSTVTINNVAHATKADDATDAGNINKGYAEYAEEFPADTFRNDVLGRDNNNSYGLRPFTCLLPNGSYGSSPGVGFGAVDTQGFLQMAYNKPIAYVGAGNEGKIKWSKQLAFADGTGASGTWGININGNASISTKATQDSRGQQIDTTYIKGVTGSNSTLTVTKGNGTTSTVTINNVAHATKADDATDAGNINKGYAEYAEEFPADTFRNDVLGRDNNNSYGLRPFTCLLPNGSYGSSPGVGFGAVDTQGFLQMAYNKPIAYVGAGNEGKIKWSKQLAFTDSPTLTGTPTAPTPSTSDNSTKIATTAFVKSLFTASKQKNGWWKDGNTGFIYQWGIGSCSGVFSKTFDFNISFPNTCFNVLACDNGSSARSLGVSAKDNSTFIIYILYDTDFVFNWFAIGY